MPEKLFVGGLPFDFSDDQLRNLFAKAGTVLAAVMVPDPKNNRTRGFGFVTLPGKQEAEAAIKSLNGTKVGEKNIFVTPAREKTPKPAPTPPSSRPAPRDDERAPFRGPPRERGSRPFSPRPPKAFGGRRSDRPSSGPRHARSGKPARKPFYQKFTRPGRSDR